MLKLMKIGNFFWRVNMLKYRVPLVPGPTSISPDVLKAMCFNYPSGDLEPEIQNLVADTEKKLKLINQWNHDFILMSGEAMVCLWGALKSLVNKNDRVLSVNTGLFGKGIGEMAASCGARVKFIDYGITSKSEQSFQNDFAKLLDDFRPDMVTLVHCETPTGLITPLEKIGSLIRASKAEPIFYVDAVASMGTMKMNASSAGVDILLGGSQKAFSCPPDMGIIGISPRAKKKAHESTYAGYDSLASHLPTNSGPAFPYTPNWHGLAALNKSCSLIIEEGLDNVWARHSKCSQFCIEGLHRLGVKLYPGELSLSAPGVTAAWIPDGITWPELDSRLRNNGVVVGGNYADLAGKVFRIGHMGTQARVDYIKEFLESLKEIIE